MRYFVSLQIHLPVVVNSILPTQLYDPQSFILVQPCAQGFVYEHLPPQHHLLWATTAPGKKPAYLFVIPKISLSLTPPLA